MTHPATDTYLRMDHEIVDELASSFFSEVLAEVLRRSKTN